MFQYGYIENIANTRILWGLKNPERKRECFNASVSQDEVSYHGDVFYMNDTC